MTFCVPNEIFWQNDFVLLEAQENLHKNQHLFAYHLHRIVSIHHNMYWHNPKVVVFFPLHFRLVGIIVYQFYLMLVAYYY